MKTVKMVLVGDGRQVHQDGFPAERVAQVCNKKSYHMPTGWHMCCTQLNAEGPKSSETHYK